MKVPIGHGWVWMGGGSGVWVWVWVWVFGPRRFDRLSGSRAAIIPCR